MMHVLRFLRGYFCQESRRQRVFPRLVILILLTIGIVGGAGFTEKTAEAWSPSTGVLPGSDAQVFWPDLAVDNEGMVHAVWHDLDGQDATAVMYVKGQFAADGSSINWITAIPLSSSSGLRAKTETAHVAVDKNNTVHVIFMGTNDTLYYFYSTTRGDTWQAESIPLYEPSWHPDLAVDDNGTVYVTWSNGVGDGESLLWYTYRLGANQWANPVSLAGPTYLIRENNIAVSMTDGQPYVHLLYDYKPEEHGDIHIYYSRGAPNSFSAAINFTSYLGLGKGDNAFIEADQTVPGLIYASFVTGSTDTDFSLVFTLSSDNGLSWPGGAALNLGYNVWPESSNIFGYNGRAHIVSEEKYWDGDGFSTILIWYRAYELASASFPRQEQISPQEKSTNASIAGGGPGKIAAWVRGFTDNILFSTEPLEGGTVAPTATPTPPPDAPTATPTLAPDDPTAIPATPTPTTVPDKPSGRIQVENGAPLITSGETFVTFILDSGKADEYKLWNGGDTEPSFKAIPNISAPLEGPGGTYVEQDWSVFTSDGSENYPCTDVTVKGKFRNSSNGKASDEMSAFVVVDPGVDADVTVQNPATGASGYTNQLFYMLNVEARSGECSKLLQVEVGEETATTTELSAGAFSQVEPASLMPLIPGTSADHTIVVKVTDGVGHEQTYERVITVDTESPQVSGDAATLQAGDASDVLESVLVDLDFANVAVTDNLYGTKGEEKPFWGVQIANSRENIPVSEVDRLESELNWQAVEVMDADVEVGANGDTYAFTVADWNLYDGLASSDQGGGTYYVYARVMDGAGNLSTVVLQSNEIRLSDNPVTPSTPTPSPTPTDIPQQPDQLEVYIPIVRR
jgi:hypothetical protein